MIDFSVVCLLCSACFCVGMALSSFINKQIVAGGIQSLLCIFNVAYAAILFMKG